MTSYSLRLHLAALFDRAGVLAIASGVLIALSFPNTGLSFLAWIALIPLLIALEGASTRTAFRIGFTCGLSAYAIILYWINIVVTRYGHLPWAVSIPIYLMLVAWLAIFYGLSTLAARVGECGGIKAVFTLPVAWVAFDLIRSFLLTGFPWGMLGHSQYRILPLIQIADIGGVYGITWLIVLANMVLYRVLGAVSGKGVPYPAKSALVLLLALIATLFYGFSRLNGQEKIDGAPLRAALIQGNIPQDVKWSPSFQEQTIAIYERLTREAGRGGVDLVVWPESAVPFFFQDEPLHAGRIRNLARELGAHLLIGSPAHELRNGRPTYLNSAFVIAPDGETVGRGDKLHLVPFGEYVPLKRLLPFVNKLVVGIGDFSPGEHASPLRVGRATAGLLVCYEGIFPELSREYVRNGARMLVNITNDAWYGRSSAPYQHLSIAAFRAVETRTPLLRAANTGITAIIDQNGHIRNMTGLFVEGYQTGEVRPGSADSIYLRIGDAPAWLCVLLTAGIVLLTWIKQKKAFDK
ncbi:MAG: apolipoprotein N-acyltransferase [Deltaproteobacteria bacterium]|nr:apolipoprotein N-acyltransferase [Deltaproteobacteria bacterium]